MGNHIVYMLKCRDHSLYTGYTNDLARRIDMHEQGKGAKYTRGRGPFEIVFKECYEMKEAALKREYQIKKMPRPKKLQLICEYEKELMDHAHSKKL